MMRQSTLILVFALFVSLGLKAQENVGIGTSSPHPNALLDLTSQNKGLLIPRMITDQRENMKLGENADGMLVYDTQLHSFFCWNGLLLQWQHIAFTTYSTGFGNSNFVGTQNRVIKFQTGIQPGNSVIVDDGANVGIGTGTDPLTSKFQVANLPVFADNASAIAGGLTPGAFYRTSTGVLMVVF